MTDKQPIDYPYVSVTDQIEQYNASTHPPQRTCSICAAAFTGFGGDPPVCPSCDTKGPQARCQSCFTPATLYPALNTRICIKCLAIIAKSILDSGLADGIKAQARADERERIAKAVESWTIDPMNMVSSSYGEVSHTDTANNYAAAIRNLDWDDDK